MLSGHYITIRHNAIQRVEHRVVSTARHIGYIPDKLPPVDLPGIKFVEPQSPAWKMAHRTVTL